MVHEPLSEAAVSCYPEITSQFSYLAHFYPLSKVRWSLLIHRVIVLPFCPTATHAQSPLTVSATSSVPAPTVVSGSRPTRNSSRVSPTIVVAEPPELRRKTSHPEESRLYCSRFVGIVVCDEHPIARTASSTGFSVRWTIDCGLIFLTDQTSATLFGPKNSCAAPSRQP